MLAPNPLLTRIMILGDSHTDCVQRAIKKRDTSADYFISAQRFLKPKGEGFIGELSDDGVQAAVKSLNADDLLVSMIGGNQHQVFSLLQHPSPFDFVEPIALAAAEPGHEIIPYRTLWDVFFNGMRRGDGGKMLKMRSGAPCPMVHLMPPPPKQDETHILGGLEKHFRALGGAETGLTKAHIRIKFWRLQRDCMATLCREFDVQLLMPPDGTLTEGGFLKPEYYAKDATHANELYGELVLKQLEAYARSLNSAPKESA